MNGVQLQATKFPRVGYFVINLEQSVARWDSIAESALDADISLIRVDALDGRLVPRDNWQRFDAARFRFNHGVEPLAGEYGCYASHLKAIRAFLDSGASSGVILEDDALPDDKTKRFVEHLDQLYSDRCMVVRLTTHRKELFEALADGPEGVVIGQCWFGPSGSAAAYWLSRSAAEILMDKLVPGFLPVDIALEEAWRTGVPNYLVKPDVCRRATASPSTIAATANPGQRKPAWYLRLGAFQYRARSLLSRLAWCIANRRIRENSNAIS